MWNSIAGITLHSLGGVFIVTLTGLAIAMIVLAFEVYMHRQDGKNAVHDISSGEKQNRTDRTGLPATGDRIIQVGSKQVPYDVQY